MIEVIPLKYGKAFKRIFSQPDVFQQFANDVLGIDIQIDEVHTEYEYPEPIGFVRSKYDLFAEDKEKRVIVEIQQIKEEDFFDRFLYYHLVSLVEPVGGYKAYEFDRTVYTIVVLTSIPRDGSINFSCAVSDMNPTDEHGNKVEMYPHRLVFLCPRLINDKTPKTVKKWLSFIEDSLDGNMNEQQHSTDLQLLIEKIKKQTIDPDLLAEIKDDMAWEMAKKRFEKEAREDGLEEGRQAGRQKGLLEGRQDAMHTMAKNMKAEGMNNEQIAKITGLNVTEIESLD